jgi:protein-L-isoaspartate(D-aspartate) O-methyltransferase
MMHNFDLLRRKMVAEQLETRNIQSAAVLQAMRTVPRHLFVPEDMQSEAYSDCPLPIGLGQTISQPYIVAFMTDQLQPTAGTKILEIGTGSGYQTAILAQLGLDVYTVELLEELALSAQKVFAALRFDNINTRHGNGYDGWPEAAPFDAIMVTAAPETIPENLIDQLKEGGKMIIPVGATGAVQSLKLVVKKDRKIIERDILPVRFVPLVE